MSYNLTKLIKNLETVEIRNFKIHMSRYNYKGQDKKITLLFDAIKKDKADEYSTELVKKILPEGNKNAFFQLKNRLIEEIENSMLHLHRNKNEQSQVYKNLQLYEIFIQKSDYERANAYLKKAEKAALKLESYDNLVDIYRKYIQLARYLNISPEQYIIRQNEFQELSTATNQNEQYISAIEYHLKNTNFSGKDNEVIDELEKISTSLQLNELTKNSTRNRLSVNHCVRQILLQKKEFSALADYMTDTYCDFEKEDLFGKNNHEEKIIHLTWIVNALLKTKSIRGMEEYIERLHDALLDYNKLYYDKYIWLYYQSKVMALVFSYRYPEGINLLEELKEKEDLPYNTGIFMFVYMNLIGLNFSAQKIDEALKYLATVITDPRFKQLSPDWKLNIQLTELILHTEIDDLEYADLKIKEIKRKYSNLLKDDAYQNEKEFLKIVTYILKEGGRGFTKKFLESVTNFINNFNYEPANAPIDYGVWLQSKVEKKSYYELISRRF